MIVRNFGIVSLRTVIVASLLFMPFVAKGQQTGGLPALPTPLIAVIDFKRAVEESEAGKSIIRQINERHRRIQKEIAADTTALEKSKRELEQQRAVLAPEVFKQRWRNFQIRVQEYRQGIQREQKNLDLMLGQSIL